MTDAASAKRKRQARRLAGDDRLCERYRDLLEDNFAALLLRRLRVVWYGYRAGRHRNLYRGCRRFQLAVLHCLDVLIPWHECTSDHEPRLPNGPKLAALPMRIKRRKMKIRKYLGP